MSLALETDSESEKNQRLLERLGVSVPRPRLDSVVLTEVQRGEDTQRPSADATGAPPIRQPATDATAAQSKNAAAQPTPPPRAGRGTGPVKPPPPEGARREGGSPPPLRGGRARTPSGRWKPVAGPGGPSQALEAGKPAQAELVSKGVTLTAPTPTVTGPGAPDPALANIMGDILASGQRDEKRRNAGNQMRVSRETWYKDVFEAEHWLALQPDNRPRNIGRELKFIHEQVGIRTDFEILDVGCGDGLHAVELAATGCSVTGLDLSRSLLEEGLKNANLRDVPVRFIEADMREMNFERRFDLIMCLNSTFGYFDDADNLHVLRAMARGLKPGGHLILDTINRDWAVARCPERAWWEAPERVILEETSFDPLASRLHVKRSILREGDPSWEQNIVMRAYAVHELSALMRATGLRVQSVSGDLAHPKTYLGPTNRRLLIHATRAQ